MAENEADSRYEGTGQSDVSLLEVLLTLKQSTMRDVNVASFALVKEVNGYYCKIQTFPVMTGEANSMIEAFNCYGPLNVGDCVFVLYADRNFSVNVQQLLNGRTNLTELDNDNDIHSKRYGVIIAKLHI